VIPAPIPAHSWGWDEIIYFGVPVVLALLWIRWIERRARARREAGDEDSGNDEGPAANITRPDQR
jgi:hypothetical protein